jgi:hypothetical protein
MYGAGRTSITPRYPMQSNNVVDDPSYVDVISILRTLQDIQRLPQNTSVTVELPAAMAWLLKFNRDYSPFSNFKYLPQQCILFSLAMSHTKVHSFKADHETFRDSDDLQALSGADFLESMSTLTTLHINGERSRTDMPIFIDLLRGAPRLQNLGFNADKDDSAYPQK